MRFSDLFEIKSGVPIRQAYDVMPVGEIPVIVPKFVEPDTGINYAQIKGLDIICKPEHFLQGGELLFCSKGTIKAAAYERQSVACVASSAFLVLTPRVGVYSPYVAAFLNSETMKSHYRSVTNGATIPSIPMRYVADIEINLPPMERQKSAVELLNLYNKKLDLLSRRIDFERQAKDAISKKIFTGE